MNEGSVLLRPLWPGSMPTVTPASGTADGCRLARGVALLWAGEASTAAGEAAVSPAMPGPVLLGLVPPEPVPPAPVAVLAHAVTRQAVARQATAASAAWLARVGAVLPVRDLARSRQPLNVSMFSIFHRPP